MSSSCMVFIEVLFLSVHQEGSTIDRPSIVVVGRISSIAAASTAATASLPRRPLKHGVTLRVGR